MTTRTINRFKMPRHGAALGAMAASLVLIGCENDGGQRIPSLFDSDPASAGDTNMNSGHIDSGTATGGSLDSHNMMHRDTQQARPAVRTR